jgi:thymidine phosphorylase
MEVTVALARDMLDLAGIDASIEDALSSGAALDKWREMVAAQGGDPEAALPQAHERTTFDAPQSGWVTTLDARAVGIAAWRLGAGRARKEDPVSPSAGVVCLKKPGDSVEGGEPVLELHTDEPDRFEPALDALRGALSVGREQPEPTPLILDRIRP